MSGHIGLYYPFIHFRDESWLKLTSVSIQPIYAW